jgi:peptide-methionine (S)-S-oxide reductase
VPSSVRARLVHLAVALGVGGVLLATFTGVVPHPGPDAGAAVALPSPVLDEAAPAVGVSRTAVLAGGCFWGVQGVFEHVKGVTAAVSGYAGGAADTANYEAVSTGDTGHAESVRITYDPTRISYGQLLRIFFSVVHDPTQLDRQGPDSGSQYRSAIFPLDGAQKRIADAYIAQLSRAKVFRAPIVTRTDPAPGFYPAEEHHQDFMNSNPHYPYIAVNDIPKVENLRRLFPDLYREQPVLVLSSGR